MALVCLFKEMILLSSGTKENLASKGISHVIFTASSLSLQIALNLLSHIGIPLILFSKFIDIPLSHPTDKQTYREERYVETDKRQEILEQAVSIYLESSQFILCHNLSHTHIPSFSISLLYLSLLCVSFRLSINKLIISKQGKRKKRMKEKES